MRVSVIIVTKNRAKKLSRVLNSLVDQSVRPDQVVVVDNNSEDNTKNIVLSFKEELPIKYVYEGKIGIPYARNAGWQNATEDILAYIDDDCVANSDWIKTIKAEFKKNKNTNILLGQSLLLNKNNFVAETSFKIHERWFSKFINKKTGKIKNLRCLDTKNLAFKKSLIIKNNLSFNPVFAPYFCGEDTDFGLRLEKLGIKARYCAKMQVKHEEVEDLKSFLNQAFRRGRSTYRMRQLWSCFILNVPQTKKNRYQRWLADWRVFWNENFVNHFLMFVLFKLYLRYSKLGKRHEANSKEN